MGSRTRPLRAHSETTNQSRAILGLFPSILTSNPLFSPTHLEHVGCCKYFNGSRASLESSRKMPGMMNLHLPLEPGGQWDTGAGPHGGLGQGRTCWAVTRPQHWAGGEDRQREKEPIGPPGEGAGCHRPTTQLRATTIRCFPGLQPPS